MMNFLKIVCIVFISAVFLMGQTSQVLAHVLESDGSVGVVMHVTPDDDPIAGETSGFYFEFKDKNEKFKAELCNCTFSIEKSGETIFTQDLFANNTDPSLSNASVEFVFPERNIYKVVISGMPKKAGDFDAFEFSYDLRVDKEAKPEAPIPSITQVVETKKSIPVIPLVVVGIALVGGSLYYFLTKKKK